MKHIFELRMKDQIEERSSQLLWIATRKVWPIFFQVLPAYFREVAKN